MIRYIFLSLTLLLPSHSILDWNIALQDTTNSKVMIWGGNAPAPYPYLYTNTDSHQAKPQTNVEWNLGLQLLADLIAIIAVVISFCQSKKSSKQAERAYDTFVTTSKQQFNIQTETLKTIMNQTDKIYSNNNKRDFIGYLSDCYTTISLISDYLKDNLTTVIWKVENYDYVFRLLQPAIKAATAMDLSSLYDDDKEFENSIKLCTKLGEIKLVNRKDVEGLIQQLDDCKKVFEQYINIIKGDKNE